MEAEPIRERIEGALRVLVGLPLRYLGRAADMAWLGFGDMVELPKPTGGTRMVARHALHLQCAFRLAGPTGVIAAAHDMYYSSEDPGNEPDDFEWDHPGANWYDRRVAELMAALAANPLVVERVEGDEFGGFRLWLSGGHTLAVFPATSFRQEHWRYLQPGSKEAHFVVFAHQGGGAGQ